MKPIIFITIVICFVCTGLATADELQEYYDMVKKFSESEENVRSAEQNIQADKVKIQEWEARQEEHKKKLKKAKKKIRKLRERINEKRAVLHTQMEYQREAQMQINEMSRLNPQIQKLESQRMRQIRDASETESKTYKPRKEKNDAPYKKKSEEEKEKSREILHKFREFFKNE
ncbi:hypothetical protein [Desulfonema magnum]|uniref:Uncharacterized protein n=1 Tax=Desulfonema magnum TaxID=45655 RepID=A0A975BX51_9BACT|nr:hypothetical protein [Desulfonema magnum]QTA92754.1 Uncharacterized protein dnm_088430 [Desulfonema magnum]